MTAFNDQVQDENSITVGHGHCDFSTGLPDCQDSLSSSQSPGHANKAESRDSETSQDFVSESAGESKWVPKCLKRGNSLTAFYAKWLHMQYMAAVTNEFAEVEVECTDTTAMHGQDVTSVQTQPNMIQKVVHDTESGPQGASTSAATCKSRWTTIEYDKLRSDRIEDEDCTPPEKKRKSSN